MKKVVICTSRSLHGEARKWKSKLEKEGYLIIKSIELVGQDNLNDYQKTHQEHYCKIMESDILLILNLDKEGKWNYIGPSVSAEIAFTIGLNLTQNKNIKIYCVNNLPEDLPYSEELKLWEKIGWIGKWKK